MLKLKPEKQPRLTNAALVFHTDYSLTKGLRLPPLNSPLSLSLLNGTRKVLIILFILFIGVALYNNVSFVNISQCMK